MLSEERVLDIVAALLRCGDIPSRVRVVGEAMAYAYRKGQEDMRARAATVCFQTGSTIAGTRIRALKIKDTPDAE